MTGTEVERSPAARTVDRIESPEFRRELASILPAEVKVDRFVAVARAAIVRQPSLAECEPRSLFDAVKRCAQAGLMPDGHEAAFVEFFDKRAQANRCQFLPMVAGIRKTAGQHGWTIETRTVHQQDSFRYHLGVDPQIEHWPPELGVERGPMVGAYAVGKHADGRRMVEIMDGFEIDKARRASRSPDRGPWATWPERMAEKTVAHRLYKKLPLAVDASVAVALDADDIDDGWERSLAPAARPQLVSAGQAFDQGSEGDPSEPDGGFADPASDADGVDSGSVSGSSPSDDPSDAA